VQIYKRTNHSLCASAETADPSESTGPPALVPSSYSRFPQRICCHASSPARCTSNCSRWPLRLRAPAPTHAAGAWLGRPHFPNPLLGARPAAEEDAAGTDANARRGRRVPVARVATAPAPRARFPVLSIYPVPGGTRRATGSTGTRQSGGRRGPGAIRSPNQWDGIMETRRRSSCSSREGRALTLSSGTGALCARGPWGRARRPDLGACAVPGRSTWWPLAHRVTGGFARFLVSTLHTGRVGP
jgi:hypothetical protein